MSTEGNVTPVVTPVDDNSTQKDDVFGPTVDKAMKTRDNIVELGKGLDERMYSKGITDERTRNYGVENVSGTLRNAFSEFSSFANFGGKKSKKKSKKTRAKKRTT